jgi:hypothetical protein
VIATKPSRRRTSDPGPRVSTAAVLRKLESHERSLADVRSALDIQFKRIAEIQAQLDIILAALEKSPIQVPPQQVIEQKKT